MQSGLTLLITGVGAPGTKGTIHCLRNSHLPPLKLVGVDIRDHAGGRALVDQFYTLPPPESPTYTDELEAICKKEGVDLIIPQTTREVSKLANVSISTRVLISTAESIALANHKGKLLQKFQEWSLPHPAFHLVHSREELKQAASELGYPNSPVVIKPPLSSGMRGFRIITEEKLSYAQFLEEKPSGTRMTLNELLKLFEQAPQEFEMILSEYLPGDEYSVDALISDNHNLAITRKRNQIRTGISFVTTVEKLTQLEEVVLKAGKALGLSHLFGMQFKEDMQGELKLLECNPRIQGTMAATLTAGINLIAYAVSDALDLDSPPIAFTPSPSPFYRYWGGAFSKEGALHVF